MPRTGPMANRVSQHCGLVAASLGVLSFWSGMAAGALRFPAEFDWRYMTVSTVLSPRHNPTGYQWAAAGIVAAGIFGACWAILLTRQNESSRPESVWPLVALCFGNICMAASALPSSALPGIPKGHETLALFAFAGLCLGMLHLTVRVARRRMGGAVLWIAAVIAPLLIAAAVQAYVRYALPDLGWVNLSWRERGIPVHLSFAFWEWLTCVVLSAYMVLLSVARGEGSGERVYLKSVRGVRS